MDKVPVSAVCNEAVDIAKKRGFYLKGGAIDYEKVYNTVINDLKSASLGKVTFDRL